MPKAWFWTVETTASAPRAQGERCTICGVSADGMGSPLLAEPRVLVPTGPRARSPELCAAGGTSGRETPHSAHSLRNAVFDTQLAKRCVKSGASPRETPYLTHSFRNVVSKAARRLAKCRIRHTERYSLCQKRHVSRGNATHDTQSITLVLHAPDATALCTEPLGGKLLQNLLRGFLQNGLAFCCLLCA